MNSIASLSSQTTLHVTEDTDMEANAQDVNETVANPAQPTVATSDETQSFVNSGLLRFPEYHKCSDST